MKKERTIFMIDDDQEDQELFCEIVHSIDQTIKCINTKDGKEALGLLLEEKDPLPDFIFVDLNMPVMNGYEFLKAIKNNNYLRHIPVIIYTTSSAAKDKDEATRLGAHSFITKPYDLTVLRRELELVFQ